MFTGVVFLTLATLKFRMSAWDLIRGGSGSVMFGAVFFIAGAWQTVAAWFNSLRDRKRSAYLLTDRRLLVSRSESDFIEHKIEDLSSVTITAHRDGTATLSTASEPYLLDHVEQGPRVKALIKDACRARVDQAQSGQK